MPQLPDRIPPTLAAIHANRVAARWTGRGSTFIPASEAATECSRAVWYAFRWASPQEEISARQIRLFATGDMEERRILDDLQKIEGVTLHVVDLETGKQYRTEIDGWIVVKPDGFVLGLPEAPKTWHVVECKSANDKNFNAIRAKGVAKAKPDHALQMQLEMLGHGVKRALYFVVNKNNDEEHVERIKLDEEAARRAVARLIGIAGAARPPGKIHDDPNAKTAFLCRFCRHKPVCHDGATAQRNCRTCISSTPRPGGNWWCEHWKKDLTPEEQGVGCPSHLFIPDLVFGEQINANPEARTVTYQMRDGSEWVDGGLL